MDRTYLMKTAKLLQPVKEETAKEYSKKMDQMLALINASMLERKDIQHLIGAQNMQMMKDNHANHVRFILSILQNYNPDVLVDTIIWVFRAYRSHGFTSTYWAVQLNEWMEILKKHLSSSSYKQISPYYEWMQVNIPSFVVVSDEKLENPGSLH